MGFLYDRLLFPALKRQDPEEAHDWALNRLERFQSSSLGRWMLRRMAGRNLSAPVKAFGLTFPNALGVAAGFDKDVRVAYGLGLLGFGHVEVGTLTPKPQPGNPKPRIFRLPAYRAVINRMGFPNCGAEAAVPRLRELMKRPQRPVIGVSIGKQKDTPLAYAVGDYKAVMAAVYEYADYLAVNISSPNTPGLRELQGAKYLEDLLQALTGESQNLAKSRGLKAKPLLVKIAPDLTWPELDEILAAVMASRIQGIIATNTTISREGVSGAGADESGGLSGRPLARRCTEVISYINRQTAGRLPIIGVGGIETASDARVKLDAGAVLIQVYTGFIYQGPRMASRILRGLGQSKE